MKLPLDYISGLTDGEGCFSLRSYHEVKHQRPGQTNISSLEGGICDCNEN